MKPIEYECTVTSFRNLTPTVFETQFETSAPLNFVAGQFISIIIPGAGPKGRNLRRAYSIASAPEKRPIELCIKLVEGGPGTNYLFKLREGDKFKGFAPYGDFVLQQKPDRNACMISTGTGIAPFRSMVESKEFKNQPPKKTMCLLGVRHEEELLYLDTFANAPGIEFVPAVSQPKGEWKGYRGRVTDYIKSLTDFEWLETEFYLCGNGAMIKEMKEFLQEKGVAKDSIHQEIYYR